MFRSKFSLFNLFAFLGFLHEVGFIAGKPCHFVESLRGQDVVNFRVHQTPCLCMIVMYICDDTDIPLWSRALARQLLASTVLEQLAQSSIMLYFAIMRLPSISTRAYLAQIVAVLETRIHLLRTFSVDGMAKLIILRL